MRIENEILVIINEYISHFPYTIEISKSEEFGGSSLFIS